LASFAGSAKDRLAGDTLLVLGHTGNTAAAGLLRDRANHRFASKAVNGLPRTQTPAENR
jgi:hypothetical protein